LNLRIVALCVSLLCFETASAKSAQNPPPPMLVTKRVTVSEKVQKERLSHVVEPVYPPVNGGRREDGTVVLHIITHENGTVASATYVSGPVNLKKSAIDAVRQWRYQPTLLNGEPVEVDTTVSVVFPPLTKTPDATPR
jgi:periplasmic protein TonB